MPAAVEAQKAVARSAKESLEILIPEIKHLNKKEGALIDLYNAIEQKANRITNRNIMGIDLPMKGTMGGVVGDYPGAMAGLVLGVLETPRVKSRIAIVLNRIKEKGFKTRLTPTIGRLTLREGGAIGREEKEKKVNRGKTSQ